MKKLLSIVCVILLIVAVIILYKKPAQNNPQSPSVNGSETYENNDDTESIKTDSEMIMPILNSQGEAETIEYQTSDVENNTNEENNVSENETENEEDSEDDIQLPVAD